MKNLILLFVLAVMTIVGAHGQSKFSKVYKPDNTLYVYSVDGLSLRAEASPQGKVLAVIKLGKDVLVLPDTKPSITFESTGVPGTWVKVKADDKEGYVFDGFLSRYAPMPISGDIELYLKSQHKVTSEITQPPDSGDYNDYRKLIFENGIEYLLNAPVGGTSITTSFPSSRFTFQEVFLLSRLAFPEFFKTKICTYKEGDMACDFEFAILSIKSVSNQIVLEYGRGD